MKKIIFVCFVCALFVAQAFNAQAVSKIRKTQNKNPQLVAQKFYAAWRLKNKKAALKLAEKVAVAKLFSVNWRPMKFEGCTRREEGGFECIYRDKKNDFSLAMIVEGGVSAGGYNVASLSFSSEV